MPMGREVPPEVWLPRLAKMIITRHWLLGRCGNCRADGCESLSWARVRLKVHRMERNRTNRYGEDP